MLLAKFREFNSQAGEGNKFSESEVGQVETLVRNHSEPTPLQLEIFWRMLQWPAGKISDINIFHVLHLLSLAAI